jgi:hypothetical protein
MEKKIINVQEFSVSIYPSTIISPWENTTVDTCPSALKVQSAPNTGPSDLSRRVPNPILDHVYFNKLK